MTESLDELHQKFPFLSYGTYLQSDYIGIIQNSDQQLLSMYLYNQIPDEALRKEFLACGDTWFWESNRTIPINIFLKERFSMFRPYLRMFSRKEFTVVWGPVVSLQESLTRKIKRRQIQLIRRDLLG